MIYSSMKLGDKLMLIMITLRHEFMGRIHAAFTFKPLLVFFNNTTHYFIFGLCNVDFYKSRWKITAKVLIFFKHFCMQKV